MKKPTLVSWPIKQLPQKLIMYSINYNLKQNPIHQLLIIDIARRLDSIMNCKDIIEAKEIKWMLPYPKEYLVC
jgi:hypothetical protein